MEDQAARLRKLVENKTSYSETKVEAISQSLQETLEQPSDVQMAQASQDDTSIAHTGARTIAITSGKGGVGKTNFTINLAIALGKKGKKVIVIDADKGMANVDVLLGTSSRQNMMDLLEEGVTLEDVLLHGPYGVHYISGGSGIEYAGDLSWEQQKKLFTQLSPCDDLADFILIDTGAGIGRNVLDFVVAADEVILITTPEPTSLTDGYAVLKAYQQVAGTQPISIIVNRVYDVMESQEAAGKLIHTAQKFLQMKIEHLGYICDDRHLVQAVRKQVPVIEAFPTAMSARCIQSIANSILTGEAQKVHWGWSGFLQKFFQPKNIF